MKNLVLLIFSLFLLSSCTKDYWDDFEWGFDYLKKKEKVEDVPEYDIWDIVPPNDNEIEDDYFFEQEIDSISDSTHGRQEYLDN